MKKIAFTILTLLIALVFSCSKKEAINNSLPNNNLLASSKAGASIAALDIGINDPNIKYFGRWDFSNSTLYVSYWGGAYFKVKFTGTTAKVKVGNTSNFYAKIDNGPWTSYIGASGTINLTPTALSNGIHSLSVAQGKDYDYLFKFQGLVLDNGAVTSAPAVGTDLIEYIGDSITAGFTDPQANVSDYAWACSEALGTEHTQIAYPGICLVSGYTTEPGLDVGYFKLQGPNYPSSANWNFANYTAKIVVINLGTNDNNKAVPDATFQSSYTTFLNNVRSRFPNAEIFAMRTFANVKAAPTQAAVNARIAAGDSKVHYVNTNGWLTAGSSDFTDGLHPSVSGHIKVSNQLQPILAPYLTGAGGSTIANGIYKLVNRNSGLVLDAQGQGTANGTPTQQWSYSGANNQRWTVTSLGSGQYKITGVQSGRSLDVTGQSTAVGAKIQLYDYSGANNQKWIITPTSGGYYTIKGMQSNKVVEVAGNSTATGALVQQWDALGTNSQQWSFQTP
jgi:lysophospholipase L1-like esterase